MPSGHCFHCQRPGHLSSTCPHADKCSRCLRIRKPDSSFLNEPNTLDHASYDVCPYNRNSAAFAARMAKREQNKNETHTSAPVNNVLNSSAPVQNTPTPPVTTTPTVGNINCGTPYFGKIPFVDTQSEIFRHSHDANVLLNEFPHENLKIQNNDHLTVYKRENNKYLYIQPVFPNKYSFPLAVDTGCQCDGVLDKRLIESFKLERFLTGKFVTVSCANGSLSSGHEVASIPLCIGTGNQTVVFFNFLVFENCPAMGLFGLSALEKVQFSGSNLRAEIQSLINSASGNTSSKN